MIVYHVIFSVVDILVLPALQGINATYGIFSNRVSGNFCYLSRRQLAVVCLARNLFFLLLQTLRNQLFGLYCLGSKLFNIKQFAVYV